MPPGRSNEAQFRGPLRFSPKQRQNRTDLTNSKTVDGYDPTTGKRLWRVACLSGEVASSAAYADGIVFVANDRAPAAAIDVSHHGVEPRILWEWDETLPDSASPVANDDLSDSADRVWSRQLS